MEPRHIPLAVLAGVVLAAISTSADAETVAGKDMMTDVIGLMNFDTGAFTPLQRARIDAATEAGAYNGWVIVKITAGNKSQIPATANVSCNLDWLAYDSGTWTFLRRYYHSRAQVTATTISCTLKMPYTLYAMNPKTTTITLSPSLYFFDDTGVSSSSMPDMANVDLQRTSFMPPVSPEESTFVWELATLL